MAPSPRAQFPSALVLSLGGTIAMAAQGAGHGGVAPRLTAEDLVAAVPELAEEAELGLPGCLKIPGAWLEIDDIAAVVELLNKQAAGTTGFVISQATDTVEEVTYLFDLLYEGAAPVAVTGAMRNAQMASTDGSANLLAAVRTAISPQARDMGVLVALADELHAARGGGESVPAESSA
ncbi:asparaginase domain-containing protein [Streptomyces halstedii]|uniref:asparaginase domain-containing protein n=1 Tax=Streptomyces halstedii TaxID=1944 RepID=UPI0034600C9C